MDFAELWEKLREQEVVDFRLLIALPVLLIIGLVVFFWSSSGGNDIASGERTFVCYFDQNIEVQLSNREVNEWKNRGDAIFPYDRRNEPPTRLKCPDCGRFSCIERDAKSGEMPVLSDEHVAILEAGAPESSGSTRLQTAN